MAKGTRGGKRNKALPRYSKAKISNNKLENYIFAVDNVKGKSGFFVDVLGYSDKKTFRADVKKGLKENKATLDGTTLDGQKIYKVVMKLGVKTKRQVDTFWKQQNTKSNPEFITAFPHRIKKRGTEQ